MTGSYLDPNWSEQVSIPVWPVSKGSFIALQDKPPYTDTLKTLDSGSSNSLAGWGILLAQQIKTKT